MHAYIVVILMADVRSVGAGRSAGTRTSTWTAALRRSGRCARIGPGRQKTPRSRRALKLAQMAVGALREWQADEAAEREAAGSRWQDTGGVFPQPPVLRWCKGTSGGCSRTCVTGASR
jgi:hypothetical protein